MLKPQPILVQLCDLVLVQLSNWRWTWRGMVIIGAITPLLGIVALGTFGRSAGPEALSFILVGNVVLSLMFENQGRVCSNFAFMKNAGTLNYFATLPIHRHILILATSIAFLILSFPALLITILAGSALLGVPLNVHPLIVIAIPCVAMPLSGIGALIGSRARNMEEAGSFSLLFNFLMLGIGPVMFPPDRLPEFLVSLGWFSPASYAASALRQLLIGPVTPRLGFDLAILLIFSGFIFWLVGRKMDWRNQ